MGLLRHELIESPTGISHLILDFVLSSQVPFDPPLHRPVLWAGAERPAACKPIVVLGRVGYIRVQWTMRYSNPKRKRVQRGIVAIVGEEVE